MNDAPTLRPRHPAERSALTPTAPPTAVPSPARAPGSRSVPAWPDARVGAPRHGRRGADVTALTPGRQDAVAARPVVSARAAATVRLSCVVPAYNEARSLPALLTVLVPALKRCTPRWELLIVDDGSRDATAEVLQPWLDEPGVRVLKLSRNFGKEAALSAGLERARGDVVVLMDADLQHPPAMIETLLDAWRAGADVACAVRQHRRDERWLKRLGSRGFYGIVNAGSPVSIPRDAGDFRLMDRRVVDALCALPERNRFLKGLYAWVGFRTQLVPYTPDERHDGPSRYSLGRLAALAVTGVTSFSNVPLRAASALGGLIALGALAYGGWIVVQHVLEGHAVPGWATLVAGLMFASGIQLMGIGILGEYVGRIFDEVKQRPLYVLADELGDGALDAD